jgi:nucleoside-diphosphate-sugar epimerase
MKLSVILRSPSLLLRLAIDLFLLHVSMFFAIFCASIFYGFVAPAVNRTLLNAELVQSYEVFFIGIAPTFLLVLFLNGIYDRRQISGPVSMRFQRLYRALGIAALVCLAANYLFLRDHLISRGILSCFVLFTFTGFAISRRIESSIRPHFELVQRIGHTVRPADAPILVIGGAGYIGSMLCRKLLADGERVRVLDSLVYGDHAIAELKSHSRFELIQGDCRNIQSVVSAIEGVKAIANLAAIVGDPACEQDKLSALEINYAATRMLIEVARGHNIDRVVFASSCSVYGATDELMDEESPVVPISLYGRTKIESERVLLEAAGEDFHPVILRLATVFGNGYRPRFDLLVNLLSARAAQEGLITIYNDQQWRPFIHVWDVARGFAAALNAPRELVSGQVFNLGDNRMNFTLAGIADEIRRAFPATRVQRVTNDDKRTYRVNFTKIRKVIGYQCTISLREGIAELKRAFEKGSITDYNDLRYSNQKFLAASGTLPIQHAMDRKIMAAFADDRDIRLGQTDAA